MTFLFYYMYLATLFTICVSLCFTTVYLSLSLCICTLLYTTPPTLILGVFYYSTGLIDVFHSFVAN